MDGPHPGPPVDITPRNPTEYIITFSYSTRSSISEHSKKEKCEILRK